MSPESAVVALPDTELGGYITAHSGVVYDNFRRLYYADDPERFNSPPDIETLEETRTFKGALNSFVLDHLDEIATITDIPLSEELERAKEAYFRTLMRRGLISAALEAYLKQENERVRGLLLDKTVQITKFGWNQAAPDPSDTDEQNKVTGQLFEYLPRSSTFIIETAKSGIKEARLWRTRHLDGPARTIQTGSLEIL